MGEFQRETGLEDVLLRVEQECTKPFNALLRQGHDEVGYQSMRRLYVLTKGQSAMHINKSISNLYRPGSLSIQSKAICERLVQGGGYTSEKLYGHEADIDDMCEMLDNYGKADSGSRRSVLVDWNLLKQNRLVREIAINPLYRQVADEYLGCKSILNSVMAWKTSHFAVHAANKLKDDALLFHFDYDYNRFLKIFVYLSDVDETCGPHVYIENTHAPLRFKLPEPLQRDGRLASIEVVNCGLAPKYVLGERGTIIFGDTSNLHKGTAVRENKSRYILQLQFVDSIYGNKYKLSPEELIDMNPGIGRKETFA